MSFHEGIETVNGKRREKLIELNKNLICSINDYNYTKITVGLFFMKTRISKHMYIT